MSRKRDWDKVGRDRKSFTHGTLPAWWDGWSAGEPKELVESSAPGKQPDGAPVKAQLASVVGSGANEPVKRTRRFSLRFYFSPFVDFTRKDLEGFFAKKLAIELDVRIKSITLVCSNLPSEVHMRVIQKLTENQVEGELLFRRVTKLVAVRVRGFRMRVHLEFDPAAAKIWIGQDITPDATI